MKSFLLYILFLIPFISLAQDKENSLLNNWRTHTLIIKENKPFVLDTMTIMPNTIQVFDANNGKSFEKDAYDFEYQQFTWKGNNLPDTIDIRYQVLNINLSQRMQRLDSQYIRVDPMMPENYIFDPFLEQSNSTDLLNLQGVDYSGSFTRGISFGNNQNLVLNSQFNLQMSGNLGDDIELVAAISDQNIPLQPEGNTQNIQDFDRVFIQLKKDKNVLIAGDYDLRRPTGYFMNYNKKLQGAKLETENNLLGGNWKTHAAFAISGSKFARQTLNSTEGNQGPYKLRGNEGELFIIVLSGTEKIYWDGQLLERGEVNDYIIDYNRGEITFTSNRLVTKDIRIIIEFEYNDQNYLRFLYTLGSDYEKGKWSGRFRFFNEQDAKNSSGLQDLTNSQIQFLSQAGDDLTNLLAPSLDSLEEFTTERITYRQTDTIVNGILYENILMYSINPDSALYTARFSPVGVNQGNYILTGNSANGRVYAWVAPDAITGLPQGDFEPVIKLIAPQRKQMFTFGGRYQMNKDGFVDVEGSISNEDKNTFSRIGNDDNRGLGVKARYQQVYRFYENNIVDDNNKKEKYNITTRASFEAVQSTFNPLNPYRTAEFTRDWNIANQDTANEFWTTGGLSFNKKNWLQLSYDLAQLNRTSLFNALNHTYAAKFNKNGYNIQVNGRYLNSRGLDEKSSFSRPKIQVSKTMNKWKKLKIGSFYESEKNTIRDVQNDTIIKNSFYFDIVNAYIETEQNADFSWHTSVQRRWDYGVKENQFQKATLADEIRLKGNWKQSKASRLRWNLNYRRLIISDTILTNLPAQDTYLGRVDHNLNLWKGFVRSDFYYEIGSGQEPELEFVYQKVNDGEGVYTWIDLNGDDVQQINEFEIAVFQDQANYIRINTFTDRYIRSNISQFSHNVGINPKALWSKGVKSYQSILSKFSFQSALKINRKVKQDPNVSQWNPFDLNVPDTTLVTLNSFYRATLFFNRSNPIYDIRMGVNNNNRRSVLTTGFEERVLKERFIAFRWNVSKKWSLSSEFKQGDRRVDSQFFDNKDYQVLFYQILPKLTYQHNANFRIILQYEYEKQDNKIAQFEQLTKQDIATEVTFNQSSKMSIRSSFSLANIRYIGQNNTSVSYVMLEGLQDGLNYLWNINFDRRLSRNLLLNLNYEGRKTGDARMIHTGRASLRATF